MVSWVLEVRVLFLVAARCALAIETGRSAHMPAQTGSGLVYGLFGGMPLILRARVAWAHDFVSDPSLGAVFESLPGANFVVNGAPIAADSVLTSAGAELFITPQLTLLAKFYGEFAQSSQTYAGSGTLRYEW